MQPVWDALLKYMQNHVVGLEHIGWELVKIIILFFIARIVIRLGRRVVKRLLSLRTKLDNRRRSTLESLLDNVLKYTVYFILLLTILPIFGVHIAALLAGAGVAGIAIAFGAQSLLKDFFNGLFILLEDQYGVGDYVTINGTSGTTGQVRAIGLRITMIKVWTGELVVIPNGQITQVVNYSKENSIAVVEVNVGFNTDTDKAIDVVQRVMNELKATEPNIVGDVSVLGVQAVSDTGYTLRATAECAPYTHFSVVREARQRIYKGFAEQGVDLPTQKVMYMHGGMPPNMPTNGPSSAPPSGSI